MPWVKAWHEKYGKRGLVVIGIHSPETEAERKLENLRKQVSRLGIRHPVAQDNAFTAWRDYGVRAWPTLFLIDKQGRVRYRLQGELNWWARERRVDFDALIGQLLAE